MSGFINYYEILQLSPGVSLGAIEHSFRRLARRYHPDNLTTGDRARFDEVVTAHSTLKNAVSRARYHEENAAYLPPLSPQPTDEGEPYDAGGDAGAVDESDYFRNVAIDRDVSVQNKILMLLYMRRRTNIREPGLGDAELAQLTGCSYEHLEFHRWYLQEKGWIARGEDGLLAITIDGVDRSAAIQREGVKRLLTDQS